MWTKMQRQRESERESVPRVRIYVWRYSEVVKTLAAAEGLVSGVRLDCRVSITIGRCSTSREGGKR